MDSDKFFNIDVNKVIKFLNEETYFKKNKTYNKKSKKVISAIIIVHVFGNAVWLDNLKIICKKKKIALIEDASESLGTVYKKGLHKGKHTGTIGDLGSISFNGNKIITSGGGGAILTNNNKVYLKAKYLISQAKNNNLEYIHNEIGYNYKITNLHAAVGLAQIEKLKKVIKNKKKILTNYMKLLKNQNLNTIISGPDYSENNNWLIPIKVGRKNRNSYINKLIKNNIIVRPVWQLNHLQKPYKKYQVYNIDISKKLIKTVICLPSSPNLTQKDIFKIVKIFN